MAGISSAVAHVAAIFNLYKSTTDQDDIYSFIKKLQNQRIMLSYDGSITKLASRYVVEPVIICTDRTRSSEVIDKVLRLNTDIFCAFYSQAFNILTSLHGLEPRIAVDLLSTDNSGLISATAMKAIDVIAQEHDIGGAYRELFDKKSKFLNISMEAPSTGKFYTYYLDDDLEATAARAEARSMTKVKEVTDPELVLSTIFRTFEITLSPGMAKDDIGKAFVLPPIVIPITIKAQVIFTKLDQIVNMIEPNSRKKSFFYRLDEYKSGAISFRELVFASDLIKQYKQNKLKDKDNLLAMINRRDQSSAAKSVTHEGMNGFEKYYNMLVITSEDKEILDRLAGGDILKYNYKQRLLTEARAMTCTILDNDYERVNILIKDLQGKSDMNYKSLARKRENDINIADIIKAMSNNSSPVF